MGWCGLEQVELDGAGWSRWSGLVLVELDEAGLSRWSGLDHGGGGRVEWAGAGWIIVELVEWDGPWWGGVERGLVWGGVGWGRVCQSEHEVHTSAPLA